MQSATCHKCKNTISAYCSICDDRRVITAEIVRPPLDLHDSYDEYKKYEEENDVEDRREIEVYGVPAVSNFADRKHFIALSRAGNLVGIGETHEQLKPVVTEYLRKRSSETVTIYQSISSTGIKLDTETVTY